MKIVLMPTDVVWLVCSGKTGAPLAVFATEEAARYVKDGRVALPWTLRGVTIVEL